MYFRSVLLALSLVAALPLPLAAQQPSQAGLFQLPNGIGCKMPVYPEDALKNRETGDVRVSINLNPDHSIKNIPFTSSGHPQLDDAAKAFISSCAFPDDVVAMSLLLSWTIEGDSGAARVKGPMTDIRKAPTAGSYQVRNYGEAPGN